MIPKAYIARWEAQSNWLANYQVEQDLILHRIVSSIFQDEVLNEKLAFRGGTALNMLFLPKPFRYSEDCDLVQTTAEPIGKTIDRMRELIDPWLGEPTYKNKKNRFTLYYSFVSEDNNNRYKIKVEINTNEHFNVLGLIKKSFAYQNDWHTADCLVTTYKLEELIGTKLRAIYQRKKGRDFFDLGLCFEQFALNIDEIIRSFRKYIAVTGKAISRAEFEKNLYKKLTDQTFLYDIKSLLPKDAEYTEKVGLYKKLLYENIVKNLPGNPWKGDFAQCLD